MKQHRTEEALNNEANEFLQNAEERTKNYLENFINRNPEVKRVLHQYDYK